MFVNCYSEDRTITLTLNDCLSSGLKLNLVGKMRSPGLKTPTLRLGEPVQSPCGGKLARPVTSAGGPARSPTVTRGAPRNPARPAPAGRVAARARPASAAGGRGRGPRGRGKAGAGAVVSASPTRAQVPRRGAGFWAAARGGAWAEGGRWPALSSARA